MSKQKSKKFQCKCHEIQEPCCDRCFKREEAKPIIDWDDFAKIVSVDPKKYTDDTIILAAKIKTYVLLYGDLGWKGLIKFLDKV